MEMLEALKQHRTVILRNLAAMREEEKEERRKLDVINMKIALEERKQRTDD